MAKINEFYFSEETQDNITAVFKNQNIVSLKQFLYPEFYNKLKSILPKIKWKKEFHPINCSYNYCNSNTNPNSKINQIKELEELSKDKDFRELLTIITGKQVKNKLNLTIQSFGWKNYTIINDESIEEPGVDIIIDLTEEWNDEWGGNIVLVDGSGDYTDISHAPNTLTIINRKKGEHKFVKYVNHLSGNKKRMFLVASLK